MHFEDLVWELKSYPPLRENRQIVSWHPPTHSEVAIKRERERVTVTQVAIRIRQMCRKKANPVFNVWESRNKLGI